MNLYTKWASREYPLAVRILTTILIGGGLVVILIPWLLLELLPRLDSRLGLPPLSFGVINYLVGGLLIIIGANFAFWSIGQQFFKAQGTPLPVMPTQKLLISGVFPTCRNPMTFGTFCLYFGLSILIGSVSALVCSVLVSILLILYLKLVEEKELALRFGAEYEAYKKSTPFMIPRLWKRKVKTP
jgi:protein-S-isoprenylcysteine O-methyltransferase Ste14